jgi:hypothetical protein
MPDWPWGATLSLHATGAATDAAQVLQQVLLRCCSARLLASPAAMQSAPLLQARQWQHSAARQQLCTTPASSAPLPTLQVLVTFDPECLGIPDGQGYSVVHAAVEAEDLDALRFVLSLKPDINTQTMNESEYASGSWNRDGDPLMPVDKTPLHLAVEQGDMHAAQLLLEAGACCPGRGGCPRAPAACALLVAACVGASECIGLCALAAFTAHASGQQGSIW